MAIYIYIYVYIHIWVSIGSGNGLARWHQAITWTNVDLSSVMFCGIHMKAIPQWVLKLFFCTLSLKIIFFDITATSSRVNELKDIYNLMPEPPTPIHKGETPAYGSDKAVIYCVSGCQMPPQHHDMVWHGRLHDATNITQHIDCYSVLAWWIRAVSGVWDMASNGLVSTFCNWLV